MRFIVSPSRALPGKWQWEMIDGETGQVYAGGVEAAPKDAREAARTFRNRCYLAPIEMGT